jgi:hypothetical protein
MTVLIALVAGILIGAFAVFAWAIVGPETVI